MTAVGTKIFKDVPDFLMVHGEKASPSGINLEGLKRRNFTQSEIDSIKEAYKIIYRQNNTANEAIEKLAFSSDPHIIKLASFIKNSSRGIVR